MSSENEERKRWRRVQDLFHRARELEPELRESFLARQEVDDEELTAEVRGLLADALSEDESQFDAQDARRSNSEREDLSGLELGHYRLMRIVGAGSMGVIYEARQRFVERSVALKILRRRRDVLREGGSAQAYERMTQRFLAEAEVLGLLDHPGIVPIHTMERDGERSYFTMRLVRGDDFRAVIARVHGNSEQADAWTLQRALGVVLRVCETMAFAHQRGVLHRDLKPSHVMVGAFGEVYLVDWGLAKLPGRPEHCDLRLCEDPAERRGAEASHAPTPLRTVEGDVIGTPAYMPPEQARGEVAKLGARSDVYAVGALLYHLLVGRPPYLGQGERPSGRVVLDRVLAGAPTPVHALAPDTSPALSAICEKAMQRDPERRYAGMQELATDLRAFLENRVVVAHRTGAWPELSKWLQRNRLLAGALASVLLLLLGWGLSALRMERRSNRNLARSVQETTRERDRARDQAAIATATTGFLNDMFRSLHPIAAQGETVTVRGALDRASQRLAQEFDGPPAVAAEIHSMLGVAYYQLGHYAEAHPHLEAAYRSRQRLAGKAGPEVETSFELLRSMGEYGVLLRDMGRLEEAEGLLRNALAQTRTVFGTEARETLRSMGALAQLLLDRECFDEARELARQLLESSERSGSERDEDVLVALEVLGSVSYRLNDFEKAEIYYRRQLELNQRLFGSEHSNSMIATTNLAAALEGLGRDDEALALSSDLVEHLTTVFGVHHRETLTARANLGLMLCNQGRVQEGIETLSEALAHRREVFGSEHPGTLLAIYNLAEVYRRSFRFAEALPLYRELLEVQSERLDSEHPDLRRTMLGLADCLMYDRQFEEAAIVLRELLALQRRNADGPLSNARDTALLLADCYGELGWTEELKALQAEPDERPLASD